MSRYRLPSRALDALCDLVERHGLTEDYVPVPIKHIAASEGWQILYRDRLPEVYGLAVVTQNVKLMVIRGDMTSAAKRYTVAHEMGHVLCGHTPMLHLCSPEDTRARLGKWYHAKMEREADMIAACLMIPYRMTQEMSVTEAAIKCEVPRSLVVLRSKIQRSVRG